MAIRNLINRTKAPESKAAARAAQPQNRQSVEALVRERAYILWEKRGRPHGNDRQDWVEAEAQIKRELRTS